MSSRPQFSVFLVTAGEVVRADYAPRATTAMGFIRRTLEPGRDLIATLELVANEPAPLGRKVLVLATQLPSHLLRFPVATVHSMHNDELREAMKYEIETLVGIEIENLLLAYRSAAPQNDEEARFWVTAIRQTEYQDLIRRFHALGVKQLYLAHPAGVFSFAENAGVRKELWGGTVFEFDGISQRIRGISRANPDTGATDEDVFWLWGDGRAAHGSSQPAVELSDAGALQVALAGTLRELTYPDKFRAPLIQPERKRSAVNLRPVLAAALALLAATTCYLHWNWMQSQTAYLAVKSQEIARPAVDKRRFDSEQLKLLDQEKQLEADSLSSGLELQRIQFFLENQRDRIPKLLRMLIELRSEEMVLQHILSEKGGLNVGGVSLNGEAAQALATKLRPLVAPLGWKVAGVRQEGLQKMTSGGPWNFQIALTDVGPFDKPVAPTEQAVTTLEQSGN